jgi:hypothetical protein
VTDIDRLNRQIAQLQARRAMAEQRERTRQRKAATRLRIVLGGELLRSWGGLAGMPPAFRAELDARLTRADDRALLGLPPLLRDTPAEGAT